MFPGPLAQALRDRRSTEAMLDLLSRRLSVTATADILIGPHELIRKAIGKRLRDTGERARWLGIAVRILDSAVIEPEHRGARCADHGTGAAQPHRDRAAVPGTGRGTRLRGFGVG